MRHHHGRVTAAITMIGLVSAGLLAPGAAADAPAPPAPSPLAVDDLLVATDGSTVLAAAPAGSAVPAPAEVSGQADNVVAKAHVERTVRSLRLDVTTDSLRAAPTRAVTGDSPVRFVQWLDGLPVYGSSVVVALDADGGMRSLTAATAEASSLPTAAVSADQAQELARTYVAKEQQKSTDAYVASTPYALAYAPELLGQPGPTTRAWRTVVAPTTGIGGHEVIVAADTGEVLQSIGRVQLAQRGVCDGGNTYTGDASYGWCGESSPYAVVPYARFEGAVATGVSEVDAAFDALGDTTTFFANALGVDINALVAPTDASIGRGSGTSRTLAGIVRYCDPVEMFDGDEELAQWFCPMPNAGWYADESDWNPATEPYPGGQMFIGQGFAESVDVIAHEVAHGVTSATSNLIYQGEPGAINESMSDVFGQLTQLYADGSGDSGWDMGEDVAAPAHFPISAVEGPFRSMSAPGLYDQPAKMTDPLWDLDPYDEDYGGVHTNSGVGNYAAFLMAHGGTANGVAVTALDTVNGPDSQAALTKLARLYWRTQQLLPSNANYRVLGLTLSTACAQLVGTHGFTAADCSGSVARAVMATGMTKLSVSLSAATSVVTGRTVALTAVIKDARGAAVPSGGARLEQQVVGSSAWTTAKTGTASSAGKIVWNVVPTKTTTYRVVTQSGGLTATSAGRKVVVVPIVSRTVSPTTLSLGQVFTVTGRVSPNRPGQVVRLERYLNGKWVTVRSAALSSSSTYRIVLRQPNRGTGTYRVFRPAEAAFAAIASPVFKVTVR
jgi:Zn-dependent metalloprotease